MFIGDSFEILLAGTTVRVWPNRGKANVTVALQLGGDHSEIVRSG